MLVPLTASLYVPGTLDDADKVLVDVGTGYFIEVSEKVPFFFSSHPPQKKKKRKLNLFMAKFVSCVLIRLERVIEIIIWSLPLHLKPHYALNF